MRPGDARTTWIVLASDQPSASDRLSATYGYQRDWVRVPLAGMQRVIGQDRIVMLTDDFAPVDRLLSGVEDR